MKHVLLYLPVIHRGYLNFFEKHGGKDVRCLLLGRAALEALGPEADYVTRKDLAIRGLPEQVTRELVVELDVFDAVQILDPDFVAPIDSLVCPDEDVSRLAAERFYPGVPVEYDGSLRLRYDRTGVARVDPVPENCQVTSEEAHREFVERAAEEATKSRDWWLQVGALVAKDGIPLFVSYNRAVPDPGITAILGDPRSLYSRGEGTDDTLVDHAERQLVSRAARVGISLEGTDVYVTHFPCVPCAAQLGDVGVKRLFFRQGYSRLESASVLTAKGVELVRVV
jgi:dCMP deaminase